MIKVIIAGGRDFNDLIVLNRAFLTFVGTYDPQDVTIISGMARGADRLGIDIARAYGLKVIEMPANWDLYGKSAGYRRNEAMAQIATHLLAAFNGSKGTGHMIDLAKKYNLVIKQIDY